MRFFNLTLTLAEVESYCADYLEEKSLRAGTARALLRLVAVLARMTTELEELKRLGNSTSLWKLHADSIIVLLEIARNLAEQSSRMIALANQHHGESFAEAIETSLEKLRKRSELAVNTLQA